MSTNENTPVANETDHAHTIRDWADLGEEMWSYLTGRHAEVSYAFEDMTVEVPRDIGPDAPRAVWKFNGTLRVTTSDNSVSKITSAPEHRE